MVAGLKPISDKWYAYKPSTAATKLCTQHMQTLHRLSCFVVAAEGNKFLTGLKFRLRRSGGKPVKPSKYHNPNIIYPDAILKIKDLEQRKAFFMKHGDEILSARGDTLDAMSERLGIDVHLPEKQRQEIIYQQVGNASIGDEEPWTLERIKRLKSHFLETLEKTHFVNLTCRLLRLKESMIRKWMRTDTDFAEGVRSTQVRFGERVAHATLRKALEGDLGAQMYVLKQFEGAVNFVEPEVATPAVTDDLRVGNLTLEEQETLLRLMRKAQEGIEEQEPTKFIEEEEGSSVGINDGVVDVPRLDVEARPPMIYNDEEE